MPYCITYDEVFESGKIVKEDVKDYLANAHKEVYENDKDALEIATNAIDNLQKVGRAISNEGGKNSRGERVLADNFSRQFINRGFIDFRGQKVGGIAELAEAMQVFRDPRFETFRIVYMQGDKIVAVDGVSSRMASFSEIKVGKKTDQRYIAETKQRMKSLTKGRKCRTV